MLLTYVIDTLSSFSIIYKCVCFTKGDPLLQDLPTRITTEELQSQIALEHGQAMTVYLRRADDQVFRK